MTVKTIDQLEEIVAEAQAGDARRFIESFLFIRDKNKELVPFKFKSVQDWFWKRRSPRDIILKFRQGGFSSLVLAVFYVKALLIDGVNAAIISYEKIATEMLLEKVELFDKHLRLQHPDIEWPSMSYDSRNMKYFPSRDSKLYIGTANAKVFGAGSTITDLHASEMAKWEQGDIENFVAGFEEAIPRLENTWEVIECTPQGEGDLFHQRWLSATSGNSIFKSHFIPWFKSPENTLPEGSLFALPMDQRKIIPTVGEIDLMVKYGLSLDQIRFWRAIKAERKELAEQEYPFDDINCFIISGGNVWQRDVLKRWLNRCRAPIEDKDGINIWQMKDPLDRVVIGADTSSGLGDDFCYAVAVNHKKEHLASLRDRMRPVEYAAKLEAMGELYDMCPIAVERNTGWGDTVLDILINKLHYPAIYHHRNYVDINKELKPGWYTDVNLKPQMIAAITDVIEDNSLKTDDETLIRELLNYRKYITERGTIKYSAPKGANDDGVTALGIALKVLELTASSSNKRKPAESYGYRW